MDKVEDMIAALERDQTCPLPEAVPTPPPLEPEPPPPPLKTVDVHEFFERYERTFQEVLVCARSDRDRAANFIDLCQVEIQKAIQSGQPPSRTYIEGVAKVMEVLATANDTVVKMIDSGAKLLAASRSQINIQNNTQVINDDGDLTTILAQPIEKDF